MQTLAGLHPYPKTFEDEHVVEDYVAMRLTLRSHPVALLRHILTPAEGQNVPAPDPIRGLLPRSSGRHPRDVDPLSV